jgi:hypothetical protein
VSPFRFRLQSVLRHQARKLDAAQFAHAAALSRVGALSAEILRLRRERLQEAPSASASLRARDLQQALVRQGWFKGEETRLTASLLEASRALRSGERQLRQDRQQLKKFECVRDRRRQDWRAREERLERALQDEVASRLHRKVRPGAEIALQTGKAGLHDISAAL